MKKLFLIALVFTSLIACKKDGKNTKDATKSTTDTTVNAESAKSPEIDSLAPVGEVGEIEGVADGEKIVFVNLDTLQSKYQYFVDENKANNARLKMLENELINKEKAILGMQNAMQERLQQLQAKAQNMTDNERNAAQLELEGKDRDMMKMQEDYQKFKEAKTEELLKKQEAVNKKIRKRIDVYLAKVAEEKGYDFILTYSDVTNPILFGSKKLDITSQLLKGMNEDYKSIKK